MRLLFIRHGEPNYARDGLTKAGKIEAVLLAKRMVHEDVTEFFVSPLGRAKATIKPTLKATGKSAATLDWLQEFNVAIRRPDCPAGSRIPWDWLPQDWLKDPLLLDPVRWRENAIMSDGRVGEAYDAVTTSFDQLLAAHGYVRDGLLYRAERPNENTYAFFCHFGVTGVLLSHLMNCSPMLLWQGTCQAPSAVTTVYTEERREGVAAFRATAIGDVSHLYRYDVQPSFAARFCEVHGNGDRED